LKRRRRLTMVRSFPLDEGESAKRAFSSQIKAKVRAVTLEA
jgi:hypothetical protein